MFYAHIGQLIVSMFSVMLCSVSIYSRWIASYRRLSGTAGLPFNECTSTIHKMCLAILHNATLPVLIGFSLPTLLFGVASVSWACFFSNTVDSALTFSRYGSACVLITLLADPTYLLDGVWVRILRLDRYRFGTRPSSDISLEHAVILELFY